MYAWNKRSTIIIPEEQKVPAVDMLYTPMYLARQKKQEVHSGSWQIVPEGQECLSADK